MKLTLSVLVTACKSSVALTNNLLAYDNYCIEKKKEKKMNVITTISNQTWV